MCLWNMHWTSSPAYHQPSEPHKAGVHIIRRERITRSRTKTVRTQNSVVAPGTGLLVCPGNERLR
jgi:hypothetical protein